MKKKLSAFAPYGLALAVIFYALPLLIGDTGSGMLLLLVIMPLLTFACAVGYGVRQGFHVGFALAAVLFFAPTIFIFYNASAWSYLVVYGTVALAGNLIGTAFYKKGG